MRVSGRPPKGPTLAVAVREWLSPAEQAAVYAAREVAPSDGEPTDRFSERERLIALGAIRPGVPGA